jgi:hypothetical protein
MNDELLLTFLDIAHQVVHPSRKSISPRLHRLWDRWPPWITRRGGGGHEHPCQPEWMDPGPRRREPATHLLPLMVVLLPALPDQTTL